MSPLETRKRHEPQKPIKAFLRPPNHDSTSHLPSPSLLAKWTLEEPRQGRSYRTRYRALDNIDIIRLLGIFLPRPNLTPILPHFITDLPARRLRQDHRDHAKVVSADDDPSSFGQSPALRTINGDQMSQTAPDLEPECFRPGLASQSRHSKRKEELMAQLAPILSESNADSSHIFLCWGPSSRCEIAAVRIPNTADDVTIWQLIRQEWYVSRGKWRQYIPFLDVRQIEVVRVSIAGPLRPRKSSPRSAGHFIGTHFSAGLSDEKLRHETTIAEYRPQEFPCSYDSSTGSTICDFGCVGYKEEIFECPEHKMYAAQRHLLGHNMLKFLPLVFSDPILAKENDLFEGRDLIKSHKDILSKLDEWHCPRLGELDFEALWLDNSLTSQRGAFALAAVLIISVVILAKFIFREWSVAWTVGCFALALVALYWEIESSKTYS